MWYVSAPAKPSLHQFYKTGKFQAEDQNAIPYVIVWQPGTFILKDLDQI